MKKDLTVKKKKGIGKWILLGVLALIAVFVIWIVLSTKKAMQTVSERLSAIQTGTVTTRTLTKSVGATGTIRSIEKKDISVALAGVDITELNVEIGDEVKKGDLIAVFDTSKIAESLADAEEALETAEAQSKLASNGVNRTFKDTKRMADYTIDTAKTGVDSALKSYEDAKKELADLRSTHDSDWQALSAAQAKIDTANADIASTEKDVSKKKKAAAETAAAYELLTAGMSDEEKTAGELRGWDLEEEADIRAAFEANTSAQAAYAKAEKKLAEAKATKVAAQAEYDAYYAKCATENAQISAYEKQIDSLKSAYESSVKSYDNTVASQQSAIASARDSVQSNSLTQANATKTYEKQIEAYEEQLEDGNLFAPISGIVTALNFKEGDTYQAGPILTIQDTSTLIIESEITEYDIPDIKKGQKVLIKTEATGDEEMEGVVTFVSPVATPALSVASAPTYSIKIEIKDPSDRLRLDMSASLSIIIDQHENAMTVPYNAVGKDESGNTFVLRNVEGSLEPETVYVKVLMESNYYTQIESDELHEGDEVQIINTGNVTSIWELMMEEGVY